MSCRLGEACLNVHVLVCSHACVACPHALSMRGPNDFPSVLLCWPFPLMKDSWPSRSEWCVSVCILWRGDWGQVYHFFCLFSQRKGKWRTKVWLFETVLIVLSYESWNPPARVCPGLIWLPRFVPGYVDLASKVKIWLFSPLSSCFSFFQRTKPAFSLLITAKRKRCLAWMNILMFIMLILAFRAAFMANNNKVLERLLFMLTWHYHTVAAAFSVPHPCVNLLFHLIPKMSFE